VGEGAGGWHGKVGEGIKVQRIARVAGRWGPVGPKRRPSRYGGSGEENAGSEGRVGGLEFTTRVKGKKGWFEGGSGGAGEGAIYGRRSTSSAENRSRKVQEEPMR